MRHLAPLLLASWASISGSPAAPLAPDPKLTPGAMAGNFDLETLCDPAKVAAARSVGEAEKRAVCRAYGLKGGCPGPGYEIDHWVPLCLGGSNEPANLWPQPIAEARQKDLVEAWAHRRMCAKQIPPALARIYVADWVSTLPECCGHEKAQPLGLGPDAAPRPHLPR